MSISFDFMFLLWVHLILFIIPRYSPVTDDLVIAVRYGREVDLNVGAPT